MQRELPVEDIIELYVLGGAGQPLFVYSGLVRDLTVGHFKDVSRRVHKCYFFSPSD